MVSDMLWHQLSTDQRVYLVRYLVGEQGWTYSQVAAKYQTSRNAIAGVCNRHRISKSPAVPAQPKQVRRRQAIAPPPEPIERIVIDMAKVKAKKHSTNQSSAVQAVYHRMEGFKADADAAILKGDVWRPIPGTSSISIEVVGHGQCRWPVSEDNHQMCGEAVKDGKVYCAAHCAVAYRVPPPIIFKKRKNAGNAQAA